MTAEVAVSNRLAIALAADSALTTGGGKVLTSANKIWTLSKFEPIGIMVYANAVCQGVPWETVVKVFREQLGRRSFDTLHEYADEFFRFLRSDQRLFPLLEREAGLLRIVAGYYHHLVYDRIRPAAQSELDAGRRLTKRKVERLIAGLIDHAWDMLSAAPRFEDASEALEERLLATYHNKFIELLKTFFQQLPVTDEQFEQLAKCGVLLITRDLIELPSKAGVVFAGYGRAEYFPMLEEYSVDGPLAPDFVRFSEGERSKKLRPVPPPAMIMPFAQSDVVATFMEGIAPELKTLVADYLQHFVAETPAVIAASLPLSPRKRKLLREGLGKAIKDDVAAFLTEMQRRQRDEFWNPIVEIVHSLPKDDLAAMAEALVNLTSFKRRVSQEEETVGGPIDVAVISKGDGFVWIKRKHYFPASLNPHFICNYFDKGGINGGNSNCAPGPNEGGGGA